MKIASGCDPNATDLKLALTAKVQQLGHEVKDFGIEDPIYANTVVAMAKAMVAGEFDRGMLICGTGIGVSTAVSKVKGAYCTRMMDIYQVQRATLSNSTNPIATGSQVVGVESTEMFLEEYLKYTFDPASCSGAKVARIYEFEREDQVLLSVMDI